MTTDTVDREAMLAQLRDDPSEVQDLARDLDKRGNRVRQRTAVLREMMYREDFNPLLPEVKQLLKDGNLLIMWRRDNAKPRLVPRTSLKFQIGKVDDQNRPVFTFTQPKGRWSPPGTLKCWLHKDSPNRAAYDKLGLVVCTRENVPSEADVEMHVRRTHKKVWLVLTKQRDDEDKAEQRSTNRMMAEALTILASRSKGGRPPKEQE